MHSAGYDDKYEELRNAYNSVIDEDDVCSLRVPPTEKWSGMAGICEHVFCRYVDKSICVEIGVGLVLIVFLYW